jgi:hypothetical protein
LARLKGGGRKAGASSRAKWTHHARQKTEQETFEHLCCHDGLVLASCDPCLSIHATSNNINPTHLEKLVLICFSSPSEGVPGFDKGSNKEWQELL